MSGSEGLVVAGIILIWVNCVATWCQGIVWGLSFLRVMFGSIVVPQPGTASVSGLLLPTKTGNRCPRSGPTTEAEVVPEGQAATRGVQTGVARWPVLSPGA